MLDERDPAWVNHYVERCEDYLWGPNGAAYRRVLMERRQLEEPVLRANRVGADPGVNRMPRPRTLPQGGPGLVFPVLEDEPVERQVADITPMATFCQKRLLTVGDGGTKYLNPRAELAANPGWAVLRPANPDVCDTGAVIVCEGMPDGLTAAQCNWPTVAALGTGPMSSPAFARFLVDFYPDGLIAVAVHQDPPNRKRWSVGPRTLGAGQAAARKLGYNLGDAQRALHEKTGIDAGCRVTSLPVPEGCDLNSWMTTATGAVVPDSSRPVQFAWTLNAALARLGWRPTIPEPVVPLADWFVETVDEFAKENVRQLTPFLEFDR